MLFSHTNARGASALSGEGLAAPGTSGVPGSPQRLTAPIVFESVSKEYSTDGGGLIQALSDINFTVPPGSFVSIIGPSGCGKSTLLLLTAGILPLTSGRVLIGDEVVAHPRSDVGFVFQRDLLLEWRSILDNVLLPVEMRGLVRRDYRDRALELLDMVGLARFAENYPAELSGGMRQRATVVRALLMDLPILLMDEPFGALDALSRDQMNVDFQYLWWTSRPSVLFVTHSISEAVYQSDFVVVMTPGPAVVRSILQIDLPRPRTLAMRESSEFHRYTKELHSIFLSYGVLREPTYGHGADHVSSQAGASSHDATVGGADA